MQQEQTRIETSITFDEFQLDKQSKIRKYFQKDEDNTLPSVKNAMSKTSQNYIHFNKKLSNKKDSLFLENAAKTFQFQNNILNAGNLYKNMNTT